MKTLNRAFEILTGVDPNTLELEESDVTYFARRAPDHVFESEGLRLEITITGGTPQDWVYASSFAAADGCTFVATYSGKVILLSREGQPLIVYDIGICPTEIVDVGRYTYFSDIHEALRRRGQGEDRGLSRRLPARTAPSVATGFRIAYEQGSSNGSLHRGGKLARC